MYRAPSGALVFDAGTVQWSWGLDSGEYGTTTYTDLQQATVNLFADMGAQPATPQAGLVAAAQTTDTTRPTSVITTPASGANVASGSAVTISGTASDAGGGVVAGVEVSTDGGTTWHPATGTTNWTYTWIVNTGRATTIRTRATDDSGNLEAPSSGRAVNGQCPCSLFGVTTPLITDSGDNAPVELGLKFTADTSGFVTGVRFYKSAANTGPHTGSLWSSAGALLATANFSGESASGWQSVTFSSPVSVTAGTTYVVSYHTTTGHYASTSYYLYGVTVGDGPRSVDSPPLHAPSSQVSGGNGVYTYYGTFPDQTAKATNYWVDVTFAGSVSASVPAAPSGVSATAGNGSATVGWTAPANNGSAITSYTVTPFIGAVAQTATTITGAPPATSTTITGLTNGTAYTFKVSATNGVGTGPVSVASNVVTPSAAVPQTYTLFGSTVPGVPDSGDAGANVELGVKFTSDVSGFVTGVRFYKSAANTGVHSGSLWSSAGTLLATANFSGESASGWQSVTFSSPVAVTAGATYVASYHTTAGHYAAAGQGFAGAFDNAPLHAPSSTSAGGNGVYLYGTSSFPNQTYNAANYWVDATFVSSVSASAPAAPSGVSATAGNGSATVGWTAPANNGSAITSYTVTPFIGAVAQTATTITGAPPATSTTMTGLTNGTAYTFKVSATNGVGTGPVSAASNAVTPTGPTVPAAPSGVSATAGNGSATVGWTAPANNGSAIASYTVTPFIGAVAQTATTITGAPPATSTTITGLTNGTAYTFKVSATNGVGTGPVSAASNAVTPTAPTVPAAPSGVSATAGNGSATVGWTAPANNGSAITSYTVTPFIGAVAQASTTVTGAPPATSTTITGLTNGTAYTFKVSATNGVGTGPVSAASNVVTPSAAVPQTFTLFGSTVPGVPDSGDAGANVELGVKFTSDVSGFVTGVRFYKSAANTGVHSGSLWSSAGTLLATANFSGESASGWQSVTFSSPVAVTAGATYVASYHTTAGHYAAAGQGFAGAFDNAPLHAPSSTSAGGNGVYLYGTSSFPNQTYNAANYWVDATFVSSVSASAPAAPSGVSATAGNGSATVGWTAPANNGSAITSYTVTPFIGAVAQASTTVSGAPPATSTTVTGLANGTAYTFKVSATNGVGTGPVSVASNVVTPSAAVPQTYTLFGSTVPGVPDSGDAGANVELGVKFTSDVSGFVTGVRFYKSAANTGVHSGSLWSSAGTLLATANFSGESASGWQSVTFSSPVAVTAGATYVASYHTTAGHYAAAGQGFAGAFDNAPLHAPSSTSAGGNGVYLYGTSSFPNQTYNAANYWVDVSFTS